jgi:NAD+ kinase
MKILYYSRPEVEVTEYLVNWALGAAGDYNFSWAVNNEYADELTQRFGMEFPPELRFDSIDDADIEPDTVMVAVGGDGTFLEAVHKLRGLPVPVVGVNLGRLGFLSQVSPDDVQGALDDLCAGRYTVMERTMIAVEGDFGERVDFPCALNEFTLHRHATEMIEVECLIDGHRLPTARGDGKIVSTPTGSTAYSLSVGGPIVTPECNCFVVAEIAPHNISLRPLVVPDTSELTLVLRSRGRAALASLDNRSFIVEDGTRFTIKKSEFSVFLILIQNISFYDTLRDKIMWGADRREGR